MDGPIAPPVLSTPDTRILNETVQTGLLRPTGLLTDDQLATTYEIARTVAEIRSERWQRVALQFPDSMLPDSARVYQLLARGLQPTDLKSRSSTTNDLNQKSSELDVSSLSIQDADRPVKLTILGDTSYGACCVDEIAAEHIDADVVIHYGRACLSPTARLPVLHIFTKPELDHQAVVNAFQSAVPDKNTSVILTADTPFAHHVESICSQLNHIGYDEIFAAAIIHNPSSPLPNRTIPDSVSRDPTSLREWHVFHISEPPTSLLLSIASQVASVQVFATSNQPADDRTKPVDAFTSVLLRRRYALVTSLTTVSIWGILINTLSVKNYLQVLDHVRSSISRAGKKSYLFVVGKLNAAKLANFAEVGGWVVIGCWESSLIDSKEFYRPIITPFELDLVLQPDEKRIWNGEWRSDFETLFERSQRNVDDNTQDQSEDGKVDNASEGFGSDLESEEDEPPEFDLRTGRYVSRTRPIPRNRRAIPSSDQLDSVSASQAITKRGNTDLISINGTTSPAAEFLARNRTWRGLGSDFEVRYEVDVEGSVVEEGRSGVARGYNVGDSNLS